MAIYTKRGDKGHTSLYDPLNAQNIRVSKASAKINAIGNLDELNAFLGIIASRSDNDLKKKIEELEKQLQTERSKNSIKFKELKEKHEKQKEEIENSDKLGNN